MASSNRWSDLSDFVRAACVCVSRGSCIKDEICRHNYKLPRAHPWLMLSSPNKPQARYLYSLTEQKLHEIYVCDISNHFCIGSSEGFLISVDHEAQLHITNPIASPGTTHFLLPPSAFLPEFKGVARDPVSGRLGDFYASANQEDYKYSTDHIRLLSLGR